MHMKVRMNIQSMEAIVIPSLHFFGILVSSALVEFDHWNDLSHH